MLRKRLHTFLGLATMASVMFFACQKHPASGNIASRLSGKWLEVQFGTDDNGNGVIDAHEIHNVVAGFTDYLVFNRDSTGYESITVNDTTSKYTFTWRTLSQDSLERNGVGHDSVIYQINYITESNLTLAVFTEHGLIWYLYNKQ
jgi:hypothetical protein